MDRSRSKIMLLAKHKMQKKKKKDK
jgi:hypothetical protein